MQRMAHSHEVHQRRIAFTHRDDVARLDLGKQLSKAPHAARILWPRRASARLPYFLEPQAELSWRPAPLGIDNLQQFRTLAATEQGSRRSRKGAAAYAAECVCNGRRVGEGRFHHHHAAFIALQWPPALLVAGRRESRSRSCQRNRRGPRVPLPPPLRQEPQNRYSVRLRPGLPRSRLPGGPPLRKTSGLEYRTFLSWIRPARQPQRYRDWPAQG